ncbi:heparinase II/III family protein [Solidesulfovibrio sp.]
MHDPNLPSALFRRDRFFAVADVLAPQASPLAAAGGHPLFLALPLSAPACDLSARDGLALTAVNRTERPLAVGLRLFHAGKDQPVSVTGGREPLLPGEPRRIFFPWGGFGSYGRPEGYSRVAAIEVVFRRERDQDGPPLLAAAVTGLEAVRREGVAGPRLTEAGLARALRRPLAESLAGRTFPAYAVSPAILAVPPPVFPWPPDKPAAVGRGRIMGHVLGLPPDWEANPEGELEWRHFLHRHHFLRPLLRAGGDRSGLVAAILSDWIGRHPVPLDSDGGAGPSFESLSVAWRLREWIYALAAVWNRPACHPEAKSLILRSIWEQARHLRDHLGHPGNWRLVEAAALALCGLAFPDFCEAEAWAEEGLARLGHEVTAQFLTDGFHGERSPLYHGICLQACLEVWLAAREAGRRVPGFSDRDVGRWLGALAALARPDRSLPSLNDSGSVDRAGRPLLGLGRELPPRSVVGVPSGPVLLADAGFAVLRRGRDCALLKAGPRPPAHAHADDMAVESCLGGRLVLVDPGISRYAPSRRTEACRSAAAHSCLLADVPLGRAEGLSLAQADGLLVASAVRQGRGMVHRRDVCLLETGIVVVRDALSGVVAGEVRVHWQFAPGWLRLGRRSLIARGRGFRFVPLPGKEAVAAHLRQGRPGPMGGWVSWAGRDVPAPHLEYVCRPGGPCRLWWALLPAGEVRLDRDGLRFVHPDGSISLLTADPWTLRRSPPRRTTRKKRP